MQVFDKGIQCFVLSCFVEVERGSKDLKPKTNEIVRLWAYLKRCDKFLIDKSTLTFI